MAKEEKKSANAPQKMPYDELLKAAQDLSTQNNYLKTQVTSLQQKVIELSDFAMFKRLDYLFEVVKCSDKFSDLFVRNCQKEIEETMTPPVEEKEDNKE